MSVESPAGGRRRRWRPSIFEAILGLVIAGLAVALVIGLSSDAGSSMSTPPPLTKADRAALPQHLAASEAQANQVVDGSIEETLAGLRGIPVVVNQWASWCPSCRAEFPFFQQLSRQLRGKVAFLGLDSQDDRGSAEGFLGEFPLIYPSIYDRSASQASSIGAGRGWPTTVFYDARGRRTYVRPGGYASVESLRADIERYALN